MASRRPHIILLLLILGTLAAVAVFAAPQSPLYKSPALGLDLEGGTQVVLEARPEAGRQVTEQDMSRSVDIVRRRVDKLGVAEPDVRKQGTNQIVVDLPGLSDTERAREIIGKTAELQIYDMETSLVPPSVENFTPQKTSSLYKLLKAVEDQAGKGKVRAYYAFTKEHRLIDGPAETIRDLKTLLRRRNPPRPVQKTDIILGVPKSMTVVTCDLETSGECPDSNPVGRAVPRPNQTFYYLFKSKAQLEGGDLKASGIRADYGPGGGPIVTLAFNGKGNEAFHEITRNEYSRGQYVGVPQHNAIVLDGELITFPQINPQDKSLADGIDPAISGAIIEGIGSINEARDIATVLQTGALPVKFVSVENTTISATLGKDSLRQALIAAIAGLALVGIFLLFVYRFLGLVAVIGLGIYSAFLYGVIMLFNVTLSLPGFAGMILTIGVAADANIVVFERIKEEARAGRSVKAAVATGYDRGFHTILDANVVTAITALVLFLVATAGVKGFALMLLLGTGISLVTAVAGTRAMLGLLSNFRWFSNPKFMGASGSQRGRWLEIDFMRKRYLWLALSGAVVVLSIGALGVKGLNLGIDFEGGTQIRFNTAQPTALADVRSTVVDKTGERNAQVQGRGPSAGGFENYKRFQIRLKSPDTKVQTNLTRALESDVAAKGISSQNVSASFGRGIAKSAIQAIIVSFFLIAGYIWLRFEFKFAAPVLIAVLHDIVITVGIYAFTAREVTTSTVAAVLTVLGYSIYDTIIIFDRIRENMPLMRQAPFARIVNVSVWETIRRSLATTFITLLPVSALLIAGGDTLKDFAFALLIGIGSGAYSSIFVAAPLLTMWKEREPEFARRIEGAGHGHGTREQSVGGAAAAAAGRVEPAAPVETALVGAGTTERDGAPYTKFTTADEAAKRERRRQRRRSRPHGRPR